MNDKKEKEESSLPPLPNRDLLRGFELFGAFLRNRRKSRGMTLRALARTLGITPAYLSDVEHGRRYPFSFGVLKEISSALSMSKAEEQEMFNCAGVSKDAAPPDVCEALRESPAAVVFFRRAMDMRESGLGWDEIENLLLKGSLKDG